ncbi:MAG TPA: large-conductance mechanosensitive channel protein MscL [Candidatus Paceibacterota bacterium]|nr:large-conductance mechanosensitive channel protein MscL [Candidatus Paceibacterota bacterium]
MRKFFNEFKQFAMRGNVLDLAIAVVIGGAFNKIVSSLVDTIITPAIGLLIGGVDFSALSFTVGASTFKYGLFVQNVVDFVLIALIIFLVVKAMNRFHRREEEEEEKLPPEPPEEVKLLREIRDELKNGSRS